MKKTKLLWVLASLLLAGTLSSCSKDSDDPYIYTLDYKRANLQYNEEQVWTGAYTEGELYINPFAFAHVGTESSWGNYFTGYVPSKSTDKGYFENMTEHQFDVVAGGSATGIGNPFLVAFWNSSETDDCELKDRSTIFYVKHQYGDNVVAFTPRSVKICNTTYTYYAMSRGDAFCRKFQEGDYFKLIAHGVKQGGGETTSEFYLADCKGNTEDWFVTSWTNWNLSSLGEVIAIYFTMESSDNGAYGMNTPAYFALDALDVACMSYMLDK